MNKRLLLWLLVFIILAVVGLFVYNTLKKRSEEKQAEDIQKRYSTSFSSMGIKGFKLEQTDGNKLEWVLNAENAEMFKKDGYILFSNVSADIYGSGQEKDVYNLLSKRGIYYTNSDIISLENDVNIKTSGGYTFSTSGASYSAGSKKIFSDSSIVAEGESSKGDRLYLEGNGLRGNISSGDFLINKKVMTRFGDKLEIESNSATINSRIRKIVFENRVQARKKELDIKGRKLSVEYDKGGNISDIVVDGNVDLNIDTRRALCDRAVISTESDEVILTGKPEFHSGDDIVVGEKIVFYTNNDEVFVSRVKADVSEGGVRKKR